MHEGLQFGSSESAVAVGTSSGVFISANPDRIGLIISCPPVNRVTLSTRTVAVSGQGIVLNPGGPPLLLTAKFHGNLVSRGLSAIADVGAQTIGVIEVIAARIADPQLYDRYPYTGPP
jgi:hypothetical protein